MHLHPTDRAALGLAAALGLIAFFFPLVKARPQSAPPPNVQTVQLNPVPTCLTQSPCKIIILSQEEEQALIGERMVFDTATAARMLDLAGVVAYFRDKLVKAPAGTPQEKK